MSRGPGHIERAIEGAFAAEPSRFYTVEQLASIVYAGINRIEKKHRVAVLRAANKVGARMHWRRFRCEAPAGRVIYYNALDLWSYATARMKADFYYNRLPLDVIEKRLRGPVDHHKDYELIEPGGAWWIHVEMYKAHVDGDTERLTYLKDVSRARFSQLELRLQEIARKMGA